jgi:hypothetical protein
MVRRVFKSLTCLRCGHGAPKSQTHNGHQGDGKLWWPRDPKRMPAHCPVCQSPYWDKPKREAK